MSFHFATRCVECRNVRALEDMEERAREITYRTFIRRVGTEELRERFPDYNWRKGKSPGLRLKDDYAVRFYKSRFMGKPCYCVDWSSIDHIWIESERMAPPSQHAIQGNGENP